MSRELHYGNRHTASNLGRRGFHKPFHLLHHCASIISLAALTAHSGRHIFDNDHSAFIEANDCNKLLSYLTTAE